MILTADSLLQALQSVGAASSAQLQAALGASQATVSRALAPLLQAGRVLRVGRGRNQVYLMPRTVNGTGPNTAIPITRVDTGGRLSLFATLVPVAGGRYWVDEEDGPKALHGGLPWFLSDMRPQGFLGRSFAQAHAALGLAPNPDHWNDDDVLKALCSAGEDLAGNLVIGHAAFERLQQLRVREVAEHDYPRLAEAALQGELAGSSAGGQQPKFCAVHGGQPVIVKFSPAGDAPAAQRWRDLLVCEHLALQALAAGGIAAAQSRIVRRDDGAGRVFLELLRFDRTAAGRVGMVSLAAYDGEYVGQTDNWANTAERMASRALLPERDADSLRFLEAFGLLIGNTDRHYFNVSLLIDGAGNWSLAPAYDMLPMVYAPTAGELVERTFNPASLGPPLQALRQWEPARVLAQRYWSAVAGDARISEDFRQLAAAHAQALLA